MADWRESRHTTAHPLETAAKQNRNRWSISKDQSISKLMDLCWEHGALRGSYTISTILLITAPFLEVYAH